MSFENFWPVIFGTGKREKVYSYKRGFLRRDKRPAKSIIGIRIYTYSYTDINAVAWLQSLRREASIYIFRRSLRPTARTVTKTVSSAT